MSLNKPQRRYLAHLYYESDWRIEDGYLVEVKDSGTVHSYLEIWKAVQSLENPTSYDQRTGKLAEIRGLLYTVEVPADILEENDWMKGRIDSEYRRLTGAHSSFDYGKSGSVFDRASALKNYIDAASYCDGITNFDNYPREMSCKEVRKRWARARRNKNLPDVY